MRVHAVLKFVLVGPHPAGKSQAWSLTQMHSVGFWQLMISVSQVFLPAAKRQGHAEV